MNKFKSWLIRTFTGIYGIDNLYFVMFFAIMLLIILNFFFHHWIIWTLAALILGYMLFRSLSHNISARRRENDAFFGFFKRITRWFKLQGNRFRDRKTHIYRKCPKCHAVIRLPKARGSHTVSCPRCHERFDVKG